MRVFHYFLLSRSLGTLAVLAQRFAVAWHVLTTLGSPALMAALVSVSLAAEIYLKPLLAPLADKFSRSRLYGLSLLGMAITALLTAALLHIDRQAVAGLATLMLVSSALLALRDPAAAAMVPNLVAAKELPKTQSLAISTRSLLNILAPAATAALIALVGAELTIAATAVMTLLGWATWLVAAAMLRASNESNHQELFRSQQGEAPSAGQSLVGRWWTDVRGGIALTWNNLAERNVAIATALLNLSSYGFISAVLPVWVVQSAKGDTSDLAVVEAVFAAGTAFGCLWLAPRLNARVGSFLPLTWACLVSAMAIAATTITGSVLTIAVVQFFNGIAIALFAMNTGTLRAAACPSHCRARLMAGSVFLSSFSVPFLLPIYGFTLERLSAESVSVFAAALAVGAALVIRRNGHARQLMEQRPEDIVGKYAEMYPNAYRKGA